MLNESLSMISFPHIATLTRKPYLSDLSDREWKVIKPLLPAPKGFGHPRNVDLREILNAIFYVQKLVASGKCCLMTFHPTSQFMVIFKNGNELNIFVYELVNISLRATQSLVNYQLFQTLLLLEF